MISQRKPRAPRLRGGRRGSAPAPRACAAGGGALPLHPAPARRAAGLCPAPAGAFAPDPRDADASLFSPAGGTGALGFRQFFMRSDTARQNGGLCRDGGVDGCASAYCSNAQKAAGIMTPAAFLRFPYGSSAVLYRCIEILTPFAVFSARTCIPCSSAVAFTSASPNPCRLLPLRTRSLV